jgi:hypothetical protein
MRLLLAFLLTPLLHAQTLATDPPAKVQVDLTQALAGQWTGLLEYRDYSEPATSTKRVQLPTWLTITPSGDGLNEHFVYDDGPTKVVDETLRVALDVVGSRYTITNDHNVVEVYKVVGYDSLHAGRGSLVITGPTIDNGRPAETRITLTVRRNLLTWTEENRAVASEPFAFRHSYTFTRAQAPAVTQH